MAKIIFENLYYGITEEEQNSIRNTKSELLKKLNEHPKLKNFNGEITLSNKTSYDHKYYLISTSPETEYKNALSILLTDFNEYMGDG